MQRLSRNDVWMHDNHWGEIPSVSKTSITPDLCKTIISSAIKQESPKEYFPDLCSSILRREEGMEGGLKLPPDEVIRHTIRLNLYCKRLQRLIRALIARKGEVKWPALQRMRKIPEMIVRRKERPQMYYRFNLGQSSPLPTLDKDLIHKMIEKAVTVILAQTGYEKAKKSALNTLVDITQELLTKICVFCHTFSQKDLNRGQVSYIDILEKSLRTVGFDGIHSVKDYYRKKILFKRDRALAKARRLLIFYDKQLSNTNDNIPEIHFPATGKQNSEALHAILKPGFKMLQTLDQEIGQSDSGPINIKPGFTMLQPFNPETKQNLSIPNINIKSGFKMLHSLEKDSEHSDNMPKLNVKPGFKKLQLHCQETEQNDSMPNLSPKPGFRILQTQESDQNVGLPK